MIKKYRQFIIGLFVGAILFASTPTFADTVQYIFTQSNCKLIIDGQEYSNPDIPIVLFMKDNSNFAPVAVIRDLCLKLNISFEYDNATKEIRITTRKTNSNLSNTTSPSTPILKNNPNSYEEDGVLVAEVNGEKYVPIYSIQEKLKGSNYVLNFGELYNCVLTKSEKIISPKIKTYFNDMTGDFSHYFSNNAIYIKYSDYQNIIKPLIGE